MTECGICGGDVGGDEIALVEVGFVDKEKYGPLPDEYVLHE